MKAKFFVPLIATLLSSACSSSYYATSGQHDDVYSVSGKKGENTKNLTTNNSEKKGGELSDYEKYRKSLDENDNAVAPDSNYLAKADSLKSVDSKNQKEPNVESDSYNTEDGTSVVNNYYMDDDYFYASRIRRFHYGYGFGYYDPFFVDTYWYNPGGWSIGMGWGYDPWGYGYYYPGYGYYGYYNPYWGGYYHGYYRGYNRHGGFYRDYYRSGGGNYYGANDGRRGQTYARNASSRTSNNSSRTSSINQRNYQPDQRNVSSSRSPYTRTTNGISANTTNQRTYTPSYSKPRSYSRPSYNESSSSSNSRTGTNSSSTNNRNSSSTSSSRQGSSQRSTSAPSSSRSSSSSYSAPRSSSSSSSSSHYSGGSSSSRSSSSGSSSSSSRSSGGSSSSRSGGRR